MHKILIALIAMSFFSVDSGFAKGCPDKLADAGLCTYAAGISEAGANYTNKENCSQYYGLKNGEPHLCVWDGTSCVEKGRCGR